MGSLRTLVPFREHAYMPECWRLRVFFGLASDGLPYAPTLKFRLHLAEGMVVRIKVYIHMLVNTRLMNGPLLLILTSP